MQAAWQLDLPLGNCGRSWALLRSGVVSLRMQVKPEAPPPVFATGVPAMFDALLDVFAPLDVRVGIDGDQYLVARIDPDRVFATEPLWCDEELTRDVLTRCRPTLGTDVVAELHDRLAGIAPSAFEIEARGAVFHRLPGTDAPAWYGRGRARWTRDGLHDLVTIKFRWATAWRGFELATINGYPFVSLRPLASGFVAGDDGVAADNRALWFPAIANVRAALGFDREEVEWRIEGSLDARVRKDWLARLR